jgi:glycosyltransferase involved in cell wall biosynthesis
MKILFLCEAVFPENKGGVERWLQRLSTEMAARGHEVTYLNAAGVDEKRAGVTYHSITREKWSYLPGGIRSKKQAITFSLSSLKILKKLDYEVIYVSSVPILSVFPVGLIRVFNRQLKTLVEWFEIWPYRYWVQYSGFISGSIGWLIQFAALQIGMYRVTYTTRAQQAISSQNLFSSPKNILQLPGLCDPDFFPSSHLSNIRNDITFLGRFVDEKQPFLAIDAVVEFIDRGWLGNFWIIGQGPSIFAMKEKLMAMPMHAKQIHVIEDASDKEVSQHLKSSFVLLHPSKREGYGLASVEASYLGTPSILLSYPNNATLDLEISPELVVNELNARGIADKLELALKEQIRLRRETLRWAKNASLNRSLNSTADMIEKLLGAPNERRF